MLHLDLIWKQIIILPPETLPLIIYFTSWNNPAFFLARETLYKTSCLLFWSEKCWFRRPFKRSLAADGSCTLNPDMTHWMEGTSSLFKLHFCTQSYSNPAQWLLSTSTVWLLGNFPFSVICAFGCSDDQPKCCRIKTCVCHTNFCRKWLNIR